jgi:hypothetical protein
MSLFFLLLLSHLVLFHHLHPPVRQSSPEIKTTGDITEEIYSEFGKVQETCMKSLLMRATQSCFPLDGETQHAALLLEL